MRILLLILIGSGIAVAQEFEVISMRPLPDDISGFMEPVKDLNGEDCSLLKIQAPREFAFSTPLGIIKREDKIGEIWLYLPAGSKKMTFKHPDWGVQRDYMFPEKTRSKVTYEVRLRIPQTKDGKLQVDTVYRTLRDTVTVTQIDTFMVDMGSRHPSIPLSIRILPTLDFGGKAMTLSGGVRIAVMKRHGGYLHFSSDFGKSAKTEKECDRKGYIDGSTPFYTGEKRHSKYSITAGGIHRLSDKISLFEGLGYGSNKIVWQLSQSEGGEWVKNKALSYHGLMFEVGGMYRIKKMLISVSVASIEGKEWFGGVGIGINLNPVSKKLGRIGQI